MMYLEGLNDDLAILRGNDAVDHFDQASLNRDLQFRHLSLCQVEVKILLASGTVVVGISDGFS